MPKRRALVLAAVVLLIGWVLAPCVAAFDKDGYAKAISTIRCDCGCHPQSVKDCACGRAAEMREEIRALMVGDGSTPGLTGDQVIAKYVADFGEQILVTPEASGFNLVAWLGPAAGLIVAIIAMTLLLRRWKGRAGGPPQAATSPGLPADDPYVARLKRELEDLQ